MTINEIRAQIHDKTVELGQQQEQLKEAQFNCHWLTERLLQLDRDLGLAIQAAEAEQADQDDWDEGDDENEDDYINRTAEQEVGQ